MARNNNTPEWRGQAVRWVAVLCLLAGCGGGDAEPKLRVFGAASLRDVVLKAAFEHGTPVSLSDGASGTLARQIIAGAPADLFLSTSPEWTAALERAGRIDGAAVLLARNELVIAVPKDARVAGSTLAEFLAGAGRIAVADENAPAGRYTRQALNKLGAPPGLQLLGHDDVRGVLRAVQTGNAPAGFVYRSDVAAFADSVRVLFAIDANLHDPIEIHGAVVAGAGRAEAARRMLAFLAGPRGRAVFELLGFRTP